jgi:hypothetical protein
MKMTVRIFEEMLGRIMVKVEADTYSMDFHSQDGTVFTFYHEQHCCETVQIEDVCGDLKDLVGSPLIEAEEVQSEPPKDHKYSDDPQHSDSHTWTFYRFSTAKGTVTVRWLGESNGCYSEEVDFEVGTAPAKSEL